MNCANHPETAATAFCRTCGKPLCQLCERPAQGTVFCEEHAVPAAAPAGAPPPPPGQAYQSPYSSPYTGATPYVPPPVDMSASPGLAFLLGLIPGVGAIYNSQYAKAIVHVLVFGFLISVTASGAAEGFEPLFGMLIGIWYFYMPFEAYHTARKRMRGEPVDEFSSLFPVRQGASGLPVMPLILIGLGVLFLLNTLEVVRLYQILRWWPVFLIVLGVYLLWVRVAAGRSATVAEARDER